jgi:hypothetical protein
MYRYSLARLMGVVFVVAIGGSLFAVPCILAWLLHVARRRPPVAPTRRQPYGKFNRRAGTDP